MDSIQLTVDNEKAGLATWHNRCLRRFRGVNVKNVGAIFLALIVLLIFFSRTIYKHNLPRVTAVRPQTGRLSVLEVSRGVASHAEVENIFTAVTSIVEEVLVREGESVVEGQELLRMSFGQGQL